MKDRDYIFHEKWLGLAQPIEGLVFSVPVLADAQITPDQPAELTTTFDGYLVRDDSGARIRHLPTFLRGFLGYSSPGMLVPRSELPEDLSFYAAEGGQEFRPSFALGTGPFASNDPFAEFDAPAPAPKAATAASDSKPYFALVWDLTEHGGDIDLDDPETTTGPWRYPPSAKFERLLRHVGIPIGLLFNGRALRLVYAPAGETTGHLTFRVEHLEGAEGRPVLAAMHLLLHASRAYTARAEHTLGGLLAESRRRQADVTEKLARQVFEAVETLIAGFEAAAIRDAGGDHHDWLRPALEAEGDHFYQGILSVVLRLVFLLYSEDQSLLPVEHATYAEHLSLSGLYERLSHDAGSHPESMHHRFGAYGQLLALFRAVFFGVKHGGLDLPPRRGRLFDPNTFPFLEGGLPHWTAAVVDPEARAKVCPPSIDDGTIHRVLHRLVVFEGQRLSYRTLDVEQIGSIYESLMGYHVVRLTSPAVRLGKFGVWVETEAVRAMSPTDRARYLKETCGLNPVPVQAIEKAVKEASGDQAALLEALAAHAVGKKADVLQHRALAGRLVLQPGEERRRTGSHYTPRSLTEKVVKRTLEPLLACLGEKRTPEQILELKICDPAMGSGAFLVATCRELAGEIVAAWARQGELAKVIEQHGDAHLHARRLVAQKCLYGVDKNAAAVELAKLSLWLVTLSRKLPFTFVDHALRHGDSLVGLDFRQIEAFHWAPKNQLETCHQVLRDALDQAVELRQKIVELADQEDPAAQWEKRRLFEFSQQAIERVRIVADVCVGAFFAESKDTAREKERNRRLALVDTWLGKGEAAESARLELVEMASEARKALTPFHWCIEFPEVFFEERPDPLQKGTINAPALMECAVGNPPFLGGTGITEAFGSPHYVQWLKTHWPEASTTTDLSAYFLRRCKAIIGEHGAIGVIVTNSINEGDTRSGGLQPLLRDGGRLFDVTSNMEWPGSAAVHVSVLSVAFGAAAKVPLTVTLDGQPVRHVNSRFEPKSERKDAVRLASNAACSFIGTTLGSNGFVLDPHEREQLVADEPRCDAVIRPFIGGKEVNTNPDGSHDRYVIQFGSHPLSFAQGYPGALRIVEQRVRPERERGKDHGPGNHGKKYWWQHTLRADPLYIAISALSRCLVTAEVAKHLCFSFQPTDRVFSKQLIVLPFESSCHLAVLQSRVHEAWARLLSSSLENRLRYAASDCFETFPFPQLHPHVVIPSLEAVGDRLNNDRTQFMVDTDQGLTKTYNALKDPACEDERVLALRRLHEEMDRAVLDAYGWADIAVPPYCPKTDEDRAGLQAFEDEVIDRLYVLNAERAAEELKAARASEKGKPAAKNGKAAGAKPQVVGEQAVADQGKAKPARGRAKKTAEAVDGDNQEKLFR